MTKNLNAPKVYYTDAKFMRIWRLEFGVSQPPWADWKLHRLPSACGCYILMWRKWFVTWLSKECKEAYD